MKEVVRKISLDLTRKTSKRYYFASQSDCNSRVFLISIFDDGMPFKISKGMTASVNVRRADGMSWSYITDITDDGCVYFVATLWTFEVPGETKFTVTLYDGERRITSSPFTVEVAEDLIGEEQSAEVAKNLSMFQQAMDHFANIQEKEILRQEEETKRVNAESARESRETSRAAAENARNNNENTRQNNETIRVQNEKARVAITSAMLEGLSNLLTLQQIYIEKGEGLV